TLAKEAPRVSLAEVFVDPVLRCPKDVLVGFDLRRESAPEQARRVRHARLRRALDECEWPPASTRLEGQQGEPPATVLNGALDHLIELIRIVLAPVVAVNTSRHQRHSRADGTGAVTPVELI